MFRPERLNILLKKNSPIDMLLSDVRDLLKENDEDEYGILKPTYDALSPVLSLITELLFVPDIQWPFGCVSTDSEGGIRIEWVSTKGEIRLVIPSSKNKNTYIYYEFEGNYGVDEQINPAKLIWWLRRLV